jgi:Fur family ferric uptake transcriptional regulator
MSTRPTRKTSPGGKKQAQLGDGLRSSGVRVTSVRERILQAICTFNGHFRAEDLAARLRDGDAPVSLVTVYRNLPVLERAGVIRRTCLVAGASRWERCWQGRHHDHLICTACGKVVEFEYRAIDVLQESAAAEHGFLLTGHHLELLGLCPSCRKREAASG